MAKTYKTGILFTGDSKGGVRSIRLTEYELKKLNAIQKESTSYAKRLSSQFKSLASNSLKVATAVGAVAGVSFAHSIKQSIDFADQVQKLSIRLGASTEALSEYRYVAELSGVTFEQLSTSWQRQTRRIAEAAKGTGEAKKALAELGLSAQQLKDLRPEEQFEILADALNNVQSEADRVRLAMKFWDSEGVAMLQVTQAGAEGIREMRQEAEKLGLTLSRDQADAAAEANDAITRLSYAWKGAANSVAVELAPAITDLVQRFGELVRQEGVIVGFLQTINEAFVEFAFGIGRTKIAINEAEIYAKQLNDQSAQLDRLSAGLDRAKQKLSEMIERYGESNRMVALQRKVVGSLENQYAQVKKEIAETESAMGRMEKVSTSTSKTILNQAGAVGKLSEAQQWYNRVMESMKDDADRYLDQLDLLEQYTTELGLSEEEVLRIQAYLHEQYNELAGGADEAAAATDGLAKSMRDSAKASEEAAREIQRQHDQIANSLTDALMRGFEDGKSFASNFVDTLENLFKSLVLRPIIQPIAAGLAGGVTSLFGIGTANAAGFGGMDDILNIGSSLFSGGGILGSAAGGIAGLFGAGAGSALEAAAFMSAPFEAIGAGGIAGAIGGGGSITAALGAALPVVGLVLGAASLLGAFKDEEAKTRYNFSAAADFRKAAVGAPAGQAVFGKEGKGVQVNTAFGALGFSVRHTGNEGQLSDQEAQQLAQNMAATFQGLSALDSALAGLLDSNGLDAVTAAMEDFSQALVSSENLDLDGFLKQRYQHVFDAIGGQMDQVWDTMIGKSAGVEVTEVLGQVVSFLVTLDQYQNLAQNYADAVEIANASLFDAAQRQAGALWDLIVAYDGSIDANRQLTQGLAERYQLELQMLSMIDSVAGSINTSFARSIEQIKLSQMSEAQKYDYLTDRAEALAQSIATMTDPERIKAAMDEINSLAMSAYNSLDPSQQGRVAQEFIGFYEEVLDKANERLEAARAKVEEENAAIQAGVEKAVVESAAAYKAAAATQQEAATNMQTASAGINAAVERLSGVADAIGAAVSRLNGVAGSMGSAANQMSSAAASFPRYVTVRVEGLGAEVG